jgi:hypothetical protein
MNKFQNAAATYIDCGYNPLPLWKTKAQMLPSGNTYLHEKHDDLSVFQRAEAIGVVCGTVSDFLFCIDFDQKNGNDVQAVFYKFTDSEIFKKHQEKAAIYRTPSGGYHIFFKATSAVPTMKISKFSDGNDMIEIRGQGAYAACEPSPGYVRIFDIGLTEVKRINQQSVSELINLAASFSELIQPNYTHEGKEKRTWPDSWDATKPDGKYNEECEQEAKELLIEAGWQYVETRRDGVEYWTRPGKDMNDGHSATYGRFRNCFYVFSGGAGPFQAGKGYTPFNIYTLLTHSGDWRKAKDELCDRFGMVKYSAVSEIEKSAIDFPIDVFPQDIQRLIVDYKNALNYNPDFMATSIMSAIAMVVGNKVKLRVKNGWEAPLIFWFAIVGDRGTMKSHPLASALKPIRDIDARAYEDWSNKIVEYNAIPEKERKGEPRPEFKQIILQDSTLEALHKVHKFNPRGIGLYKDELIGFINDMNKYRGGSDEQFWLESFNNKSLVINRATKDPMMVENTCINVIGTIQPDVLITAASKHTDNGLLDRFLYTKTETNIHVMSLEDVNDELIKHYDAVINEFDTHFNYYKDGDQIILQMNHEQMKIYVDYDRQIVDMQGSDNESPAMKSYLSKARTYFPRFVLMSAMLNVISGSPIEITDECLHNAWKICDYYNRSARDLFAETTNKTEIREVKSLMKGRTTPEKVRELSKMGMTNVQIASELGLSKQRIGVILGKKVNRES